MDIIQGLIETGNAGRSGWRIVNNGGVFGVYNNRTSNVSFSVLNNGVIGASSNIPSNIISSYSNINVITNYTSGSSSSGGSASQWTTVGTEIYYNSGNVGIGTIDPAAPLHVYNTSNARLLLDTTTTGTASVEFRRGTGVDMQNDYRLINDTNGYIKLLCENSTQSFGDATANLAWFSSNETIIHKNTAMNGRVGIGTNYHATRSLDVLGDANISGLVSLGGLSVSDSSNVIITNSLSSNVSLTIQNNNTPTLSTEIKQYPETPSTNADSWTDNGYNVVCKTSDAILSPQNTCYLFNNLIASPDHYHSTQLFNGSSPYNYTGSTSFKGTNGLVIYIDLGRPIVLRSMKMAPRDNTSHPSLNFIGAMPKTFKIYASNDSASWTSTTHASWTEVHSQTTSLTYNYKQYTEFGGFTAITTEYRYFTMVVYNLIGNYGYLTLSEWDIFGTYYLTTSTTSSVIELIRGTTIDSKTDYKIGNYDGSFKVISSTSGVDTDYIRITTAGAIFNPTGTASWNTGSDRRIKENIERASYDKCFDNINRLELNRFNYIDGFNTVSRDRAQLGFIAQEVYDIFPKAISTQRYYTDTLNIPDLLSIDITQINYSLYGAVKKLIEINNEKDNHIKILGNKLKTLETFLNIAVDTSSNIVIDTSNLLDTSNIVIDTSNLLDTSNIAIDTSNLLDTSNIAIDTSNLLDTSNIVIDTSNLLYTSNIAIDTSNLLDTSNIAIDTSNLLDTSNIAIDTSNLLDTSNIAIDT